MRRRPRTRPAVALLALTLFGCGGGGSGSGGATSAPQSTPSASNQVTVKVMQDPDISNVATINIPYVTVTVCDSNGSCQSVDHVVVDTGSYGLRILKSAVSQLVLPPVAGSVPGQSLAECATFLDGYMWGSVAMAGVRIGGEKTTTNIPIQLIADPSLPSAPSPSCTGTGPDESTLVGIGGNGILGVGQFVNDAGLYYSCSASSCTALTTANGNIPSSQQVSNPVASFPTDNNGVILQMPGVPGTGAATASGVLTFGIGTQSDNDLGGYSILRADFNGNFSATLQGQTYGSSFIDSGSNRNFATLSGVPTNSYGDYAPPALTTYPITLSPNVGSGTALPTQIQVIDSEQLDFSNMAFNDIDDPGTSSGAAGYVDLGFPYFFGKSIALVIAGRNSPQGVGPLYGIR